MYVDSTVVYEVIPQCSPSYLPFVVNDISQFAFMHSRHLISKKCRELIVNFVRYKSAPTNELNLMDTSIKWVSSYKILGVHVSHSK